MNVTIDLPPEVADRLARKATGDGQDLVGYVQRLAVRDADVPDTQALAEWDALIDSFAEGDPEDHRETVETLTRALNEDSPHRPYNPAGLRAALAAFDEDNAQEQRETLTHLRTALDQDRPGQRRVFGPGVNPMPTEGDA